MSAPPSTAAPAPAPPAKGRAIALGLTSALGAVMAVAIGAVAAQFLAEPTPFFVMLGAAWAALTLGRVLWVVDLPAGYGGVWAELGMGAAAGLAGMGALNAFFDGGPGWPATPWWALAAGIAWGVYRAHAPVLRRIREQGAPPRLVGGILDPREMGALLLLVAGYALLGLAAHRLFSAFAGIVPQSGKVLGIGLAVYALYGAKLLLKFAAHDSGPVEGGFVAWFKANLLRNALVVVVLVAYATYRSDLARVVPYFPLVEFGLGMAVFGAVLARLRWRLQRERTDVATASDARPHVQRVDPITEGEYESVARPLSRFLESGRGLAEYETTLRETARLDARDAQRTLDPLRRYAAPIEEPPLPLPWAVAASVVAGLALAIGAAVLIVELASSGEAGAPPGVVAVALQLGLIVVGLSVYRAQDHARAHRRPWIALGLAGAGTLLVALAALLFLAALPAAPGGAYVGVLVVALVLLAIPLGMSLRLARRMRDGEPITLPADPPSAMLARGIQGTRRMAAVAAVGAVLLLVVVPFVIEWLVAVAPVPDAVSATYDRIASGTVWVLVAMGGSALMRYFGYARARPMVLAREKRWRDERIQLHSEIMRRLERV